MSIKTTKSTKQRNAYRHRVDEFVVKPAAEIAKYRACWMAGLAVVVVSCAAPYVGESPKLAAVGFVLGCGLVGLGWGGDDAIRRNFYMFRRDVLGHVLEDIDEEIEDSGDKFQPFVESKEKGKTTILVGKFDFTAHQWRKFATAVTDNHYKINHSTIRNAGIFTNPTKNGNSYLDEFKRIGWLGDGGLITDTALAWLGENNIIQTPPPLANN